MAGIRDDRRERPASEHSVHSEIESKLVSLFTDQLIHASESDGSVQFSIGDRTSIVGGPFLWRLIGSAGLKLTSEDHRQMFGLTEPVDAVDEFNSITQGKRIRGVSADYRTGDLLIQIGDDCELQVMATSAGYENWSVWSGDGTIAVCAGGRLV